MSNPKAVIPTNRVPGISFVVRCRNEEKFIESCITSLQDLSVPHEIIVILHRCMDGSRAIVERLRDDGYPIRIYEYDQDVSRAGYETLVTPVDHPHSLMTYYRFCFSKVRYNWIMKWDADFTASDRLIDYLNTGLDMALAAPTKVRIGCRLGDAGIVNTEPYLTNALTGYAKYVFWEVPEHMQDTEEVSIDPEYTIQSVSYTVLKDYWRPEPWFADTETSDKELTARYRVLVSIVGPEPTGMARASHPDCDDVYRKVCVHQEALTSLGINLYK